MKTRSAVRKLLIGLFLFTQGCYYEAENGRIPVEYLEEVRPYEGRYFANANSFDFYLDIAIQDDGLVSASVINDLGSNQFLANCPATLGSLIGVDVKSSSKFVRSVEFYAKLRSCGLPYDSVSIIQKKPNEFFLKIVETTKIETDHECYETANGQIRCRPIHVVTPDKIQMIPLIKI